MSLRTNRAYTQEFKIEAIKLVLEQNYKQIDAARNLGVEPSLLGKWIHTYKFEAASGNKSAVFPGKGNLKPIDAELASLKKQLLRVLRERDILKKAIGYFASQSKVPIYK